MKKTSQHIDDILLDYLDGKLSIEQKNQVETMMMDDTIRQRYEELKETNALLKTYELQSPSINFTHNVMKGLNAAPRASYFSFFKSIWLLVGVMMVIITTGVLLSMGVFDQSVTAINPVDVGLPSQYMKQNIPTIEFDSKIIVYSIVLLNVIVGFLILDRAILKPFFERRMHMGQ